MRVIEKYRDIVKGSVVAAAALGVPGALSFGLDSAGMTAIWGNMIYQIATKSGHTYTAGYTAKVATGVFGAVGAYVIGSKILTSLLNFIPGIGTIGACGLNGFLNGLYTYQLGKAVSTLLDRPGLDEDDAAAMISMILPLVLCIPDTDSIRDVISMIRGS